MWKTGYPPLEFSEDSDYQLLESESFFAVDLSAINNMDSNMLMLFGIVFVVPLLLAIKQCLVQKQEKALYEPINDERQYGGVAVVNWAVFLCI